MAFVHQLSNTLQNKDDRLNEYHFIYYSYPCIVVASSKAYLSPSYRRSFGKIISLSFSAASSFTLELLGRGGGEVGTILTE